MPCPHCGHRERPDEHHGIDHRITDRHGQALPLSCYTDEGELIAPAEEESQPSAAALAAVTPDPWLDPSHPAHKPPF